MEARKPIDMLAFTLMFFVCVTLGLQQVAIKAAETDISPVLQVALRSGIGALLVALVMGWRRQLPSFSDGNWKVGLVVGVLFTLDYLMFSESLLYTSASHAVVFMYTSPVFTALLLHYRVPTEQMSRLQIVGILLAFVGIVAAFLLPQGSEGDSQASNMLLGDTLALLSGVFWGATTVVIRTSRLARISAQQTLLYQLIAAFVLLLVFAIAMGQTHFSPTPIALASLGFQSIIVSFAAFLIWFWLLRHYLASRLGVLSFMTPLLGVGLGIWLLNEPVEPGFLVGALLVIVGIVLVSGDTWLKQMASNFRASAPPTPQSD